MTRVKMRSFIVPGQHVELRVEFRDTRDAITRIACSAHDGGARPIATCQIEFNDAGAAAA
jgi:3-hydroxymyristoyl/3-hydroxydecanoyl-(acyl carrier protein) dehydratase